MKINFAFFGTPAPAVEILDILHKRGFTPVLIVTNPDKSQGRNLKLTPPPVKEWSLTHNIPFLQPENPSDSDFLYKLRAKNCQLFIVVAYGAILPKAALDIPRHGSLNVHYSLLPKYRGPSPVESQILADDENVGVSILLLDEKIDHGPLVAQRRLENSELGIKNYDWPMKADELRSMMNTIAGELLAEILPDWVAGKIEAKPQDHSKATYTKKFTSADREIHLEDDAYTNYSKIQALSAWGTYFFVPSYSPFSKGSAEPLSEGSRGGISKSSGLPARPSGAGGADSATPFSPRFAGEAGKKGGREDRRIRVLIKSAEYKDGTLTILRVIPEGKKEMSWDEFLRGVR